MNEWAHDLPMCVMTNLYQSYGSHLKKSEILMVK